MNWYSYISICFPTHFWGDSLHVAIQPIAAELPDADPLASPPGDLPLRPRPESRGKIGRWWRHPCLGPTRTSPRGTWTVQDMGYVRDMSWICHGYVMDMWAKQSHNDEISRISRNKTTKPPMTGNGLLYVIIPPVTKERWNWGWFIQH